MKRKEVNRLSVVFLWRNKPLSQQNLERDMLIRARVENYFDVYHNSDEVYNPVDL